MSDNNIDVAVDIQEQLSYAPDTENREDTALDT